MKGKRALQVDDILASGTTLGKGSDALRHYGATEVDAFVTNFIGTGNYKKNLKKLGKVFVTDNIHHDLGGLDNVEVISTAPLFAEAIYAAESGKSISKMFRDD